MIFSFLSSFTSWRKKLRNNSQFPGASVLSVLKSVFVHLSVSTRVHTIVWHI